MTAETVSALWAAAGAAVGLLLPAGADRMTKWKLKKKGRTPEPDARFTGWAACLLCALASAMGWGLCRYLGTPFTAALTMALWSCGVVLILIDLRVRLIPNEMLLAMAVMGLILQGWTAGLDGVVTAFFAALVLFCIYMGLGNFMGLYKIGAGDVKLSVVMALTLGYPCIMWAMLAMAVSMFLFCGVGIALRKMTLKSMLPFGPFLVPGFWVGLLLFLWGC